MALAGSQRRNLGLGLAFLAPNIVGFLAFTLIPIALSLAMAFTDWDLTKFNRYKSEPALAWIGIENFLRLFKEYDFWKYFANTLYLMMGIPFAIGGSLIAALLLSRDLRGGHRRVHMMLLGGAVLVCALVMLAAVGNGASSMVILVAGLACATLLLGVTGGNTVYRTIFYLPYFVAGVPVFILWKKLYNPLNGPINNSLAVPLNKLGLAIAATSEAGPIPTHSALQFGVSGGLLLLMVAVFCWGLNYLRASWRDGELGWAAVIAPCCLLVLPIVLGWFWLGSAELARQHPQAIAATLIKWLSIAALVAVALYLAAAVRRRRELCCPSGAGFGNAFMLCLAAMVSEFVLLGLAVVCVYLPLWASDGLQPPQWLGDYHWAKPAIMIMSLWAAIGSNNMLLYIAGISNVPGELYEAADIDGAGPFQRFWNITWPQLAPTTFFIVIMSCIAGLQGGFEMARVMTSGGPAGATTTLSYFVYTSAFESGQMGYASAVAWTLFVMVFLLTLVNWKYGSRYVNE